MSFFFEQPQLRVLAPHQMALGGEAELSDIWAAMHAQAIYVDNTFARRAAREEAYDRRIAAIEEATGERLQNPLRQTYSRGERRRGRPSPAQRFEQSLADLARRRPDQRDVIRADVPIDEDAQAIAREAEDRTGLVAGSRSGPLKWAAMLGGGITGSLRDPVQVAALAAGAGPGAARTVAGRILQVAGREALINAGIEAAVQPAVQSWREEAGLAHGPAEAFRNVLFAAGLGGLFGAAGSGAGEAARALLRNRRSAEAVDAILPELRDTGRAALSRDPAEAGPALAGLRDTLPAPERGAIDQMEIEAVLDAARRAPDAAPADDGKEIAALRLAQDREAPPPASAATGEADRAIEAAGFDIGRLPVSDRAALVKAASPQTEAMVLSQQRLRGLRNERAALAATEPTDRSAADGTRLLQTRAPEGGFVGRSPADAERAGLPMAFSEGERPQLLAELDERIAVLERQLERGPLPEDVDRVNEARAYRAGQEFDGEPADMAGGVADPAAPEEHLLALDAELDGIGDIDLPGEDGPVSAAAMRDRLARMDALEQVVGACRP